VSSCSVYTDDRTSGAGEDAAVHEPYEGDGPVDWEAYGPAKVACELACLEALSPDAVLLARSGLIGGYGDRSDRLGYWPARIARAEPREAVLVLWLPQPDHAGFMARDTTAARRSGLTTRPLADTVVATLRWETEQGLERDRRAGLSSAREQALLTRLGAPAPLTVDPGQPRR
jgi:hypothetical protein